MLEYLRAQKPATLRTAALIVLSCPVLIGLCIAFIDRPVATFVAQHFDGMGMLGIEVEYRERQLPVSIFTVLAGPAQATVYMAFVGAIILAIGLPLGWWRTRAARIVLGFTMAAAVADAVNHQLKWVFGRTWPESWLQFNKSWIRDGVYDFSFFHGWMGRESFPSGHMTAGAVVAALVFMLWPRWRWLSVIGALVVAAGLIGGNYHFVSDVIAGAYLGTAVAFAILTLVIGRGA